MSVALSTVPIVGVLLWLMLVALGVWRHHGAVAQRRQAAEQFRGRVLKDGERLDTDLIEQLLDAPRPDDVVRNYCTQRAALLPGLALETPAAWQISDLDKQVAQRFQTEVCNSAAISGRSSWSAWPVHSRRSGSCVQSSITSKATAVKPQYRGSRIRCRYSPIHLPGRNLIRRRRPRSTRRHRARRLPPTRRRQPRPVRCLPRGDWRGPEIG